MVNVLSLPDNNGCDCRPRIWETEMLTLSMGASTGCLPGLLTALVRDSQLLFQTSECRGDIHRDWAGVS
jgi:hypothetical protein